MKAATGKVAAAWILGAGPAWAAAPGDGSMGAWTLLFLAFGALVIAFQAVPAAVLFAGLLRSLFAGRHGAGAEEHRERA